MRTVKFTISLVLFLNLTCLNGQQPSAQLSKDSILFKEILISDNMTTHIVFPDQITMINLGSSEIAAQRAQGSTNVLQLKAISPEFQRTNLTVITSSGSLHCFAVGYTKEPKVMIYRLKDTTHTPSAKFIRPPVDLIRIRSIAQNLVLKKGRRLTRSHRVGGVKADLQGIYLHGDQFYLPIILYNTGAVGFQVQGISSSLVPRSRHRETAIQHLEIKPLMVLGQQELDCRMDNPAGMVVVLPKFSLAQDRKMVIRILEREGTRNLELNVKNQHLAKAKVILEEKTENYEP